jgi:EAL domain-containing protein (putative c-di-GMP-specific phosphodiesterase class I)
MVKAIIAMAHSLRLEVIAEGVELEEQLEGLRAAGCDQIQGFYYSRPLSPEDCASYLRRPPSQG